MNLESEAMKFMYGINKMLEMTYNAPTNARKLVMSKIGCVRS